VGQFANRRHCRFDGLQTELDRTDKAELTECGDPVIEADLLRNLPFSIRSTVVPVKCILRPVAVGKDPIRKSRTPRKAAEVDRVELHGANVEKLIGQRL